MRYQLWQPQLTTTKYGPRFRHAVLTLLACQRRLESPVARLPDECLFYIMNMLRWDDFGDNAAALKEQRRDLKRKAQQQQAEAAQQRLQQQEQAMETSDGNSNMVRQVTLESSSHPMEESNHEAEASDVEMNGNDSNNDDAHGDDDDDDDEWQEEAEEEASDDDSSWERQHGYRADTNVLIFQNVSSDEESSGEESDPASAAVERQAWFRRHFARIHILRALAQADDDEQHGVVVHVQQESSSGEEEEEEEDADYEPLQDTDEEE